MHLPDGSWSRRLVATNAILPNELSYVVAKKLCGAAFPPFQNTTSDDTSGF